MFCSGIRGGGQAPPALRPDEILPRSAERVWTEGRANPVWWQVETWLGTFTTDDRLNWQTDDGRWLAQLQRSRQGRYLSLALFRDGAYVGRRDFVGWHPAGAGARLTHARARQRALPLVAA